MVVSDQKMRDLISTEAAEWLIANHEGLDLDRRREFAAWLKKSPGHIEEYLALSALAKCLPAACELTGDSPQACVARAVEDVGPKVHTLRVESRETDNAVPRHRWSLVGMAASICALSVGLLVWHDAGRAPLPPRANDVALHFRTRHGEQQTHRLTDQTVVVLNTDSAMTVRFNKDERVVELEAGEAHFTVADDSHRRFRVLAGAAQVLDVGTVFDVRVAPSSTLVTVIRGLVDVGLVAEHHGTGPLVRIGASQQIIVSDGAWPVRPAAVNAESSTAWLHGQIKFDDEPLSVVTREMNRYVATPFEITAPGLGELRISGVFGTDDSAAFVAFLRSLQGVHVDVSTTRIRVSQD